MSVGAGRGGGEMGGGRSCQISGGELMFIEL